MMWNDRLGWRWLGIAVFSFCHLLCFSDAKAEMIATVAGNGEPTFFGDWDDAVVASLYNPSDIFVDGDGTLYIADAYNHRIRKVDTSGLITTVAGTFIDSQGIMFISDSRNNRIRKAAMELLALRIFSFLLRNLANRHLKKVADLPVVKAKRLSEYGRKRNL